VGGPGVRIRLPPAQSRPRTAFLAPTHVDLRRWFAAVFVGLALVGCVQVSTGPALSRRRGGRGRPEARQVVRPVGGPTRNVMNNAGACETRPTKFAGTSATLRLGSKTGCSTSFGKFGSRLGAHAPAAGGTGAKRLLPRCSSISGNARCVSPASLPCAALPLCGRGLPIETTAGAGEYACRTRQARPRWLFRGLPLLPRCD
jgi:hypothetical protein